MKTFATAGLVGLLLSGAATAQDEWSYLECDLQTRQELGGESFVRSDELIQQRFTFRFNATAMDDYARDTGLWTPGCRPSEDWQTATCTINADALVRSQRNSDYTTVSSDITISRVTGAITYRFIQEGPGMYQYYNGEGQCRAIADPTGGQRQF